jgi:pyrophosphate--fructose-6-phosphate 1-phosphotransferase
MVLFSESLQALSNSPVDVPQQFKLRKLTVSRKVHEIDGQTLDVVFLETPRVTPHGSPTSNSLIRMASQIHVFKVGVLFAANSCCASGVNNVLCGLYEHLCEAGKIFQLVGIQGGPAGLISRNYLDLNSEKEQVIPTKNLGGIELLGYGSFRDVNISDLVAACFELELTSLVIVAASDELEMSVQLLNALRPADICVTIVPQSRNQHVYIPNGLCTTSLGFDSARRVLAELAGNIAVDCLASKKYWHFINAGDAQLVAEVGLLIRANMIVTEADPSCTIKEWIGKVADLAEDRIKRGMRSGVVMVSQCAFSRTTEMTRLIDEISLISTFPIPESLARKSLSKESFEVLQKLPKEVRLGLLRQKDKNGRPLLIYWSPEEFLVEEVKAELVKRSLASFIAFRTHFLAHESRCPVPTVFDCMLGSCLGRTAASFILNDLNGYMVSVSHLEKDPVQWSPCGISVTSCPEVVVRQRGYELTLPVQDAWTLLEPKWRLDGRYRSFGPLTNDLMPPLSVLGCTVSLVALLDGCGKVAGTRDIPGLDPPVRLPIRRPEDMSPVEADRRLYCPKIPSYLAEPFAVIDSDICARASSTDADLLDAIFPQSAKLLPVQVINVASSNAAERISPTQFYRQSCSFKADLSEGSDSDGEAPTASARIQSRVNVPLLERFADVSGNGETLMSPRSSARIAAPSKPQLVRASDVSYRLSGFIEENNSKESSPTKSTGKRTVSIESVDSLDRGSRPLRVGVVFMCSQVPGCHNVVAGLFDYLGDSDNRQLIGFLGGSTGLRNGWTQVLTQDIVDRYRNQGGQDLLGHFGESLKSDEDYQAVTETIETLDLDGLVIGGNLEGQLSTALLSEKLLEKKMRCRVISVPVSAENEIPFIRQSVGYDTVTRVFSNTIANLWTECHSSRHRWYFVRLMSHHVSHLALECGLATHPNIVLVTEEVAARKQSLVAITEMIADCICARSAEGKDYGVVLIPDGVVAAVPQIRRLLRELDKIVGSSVKTTGGNLTVRLELVSAQLSMLSAAIFQQLPRFVQAHLVNGALRHAETGKIDIANVAMERILQSLVAIELEKRRKLSLFKGKVDLLVHSLAHQGRSSLPSSLDCDLAYTCGYAAGGFIDAGRTGLVTNVAYHKHESTGEYVWSVGGFPAVALVSINKGRNDVKISIEPTKLEISGNACRALFDSIPVPKDREGRHPGPLQWTDRTVGTLSQLSEGNREHWESFERIAGMCKEILSLTGKQVDKNGDIIDSVLRSLENILRYNATKDGEECSPASDEWFLNEPDDILSTCAPQKNIPLTYDS